MAVTAKNDRIVTRLATPDDISFIYATWLRSYRNDSPATKYIGTELFYKQHEKLLDNLLGASTTKVIIACDTQDHELIFGYMAFEPGILHFIYVKKPFRHMGIMHQLLESQSIDLATCQASHITYGLIRLWDAGVKTIRFNPYLANKPP